MGDMKKTIFAVAVAAAMAGGAVNAAGYLKPTKPIERNDSAESSVMESPLFRRTMVIIGDSYVANHRRPTEEAWHYRLAEKYQMGYYNYGKNGNGLVFDRRNWGVSVLHRLDELHAPADFVVVIGGHNDTECIEGKKEKDLDGKPLDSSKSAQAARLARFREGVTETAKALRAKYPSAHIVFVSPWRVSRPHFDNVIAALGELVPREGCFFINATDESGIVPRDEKTRKDIFQGVNDTAHLNAKGHEQMLKKMEPIFLKIAAEPIPTAKAAGKTGKRR